MKQLAMAAFAVTIFLFVCTANAASVCKIRSFSGAERAPVSKIGKNNEFYALLKNGFHKEAARLLNCVTPAGSKILVKDIGFSAYTVRVLTGPSKGCIGIVDISFIDCD